MAEPDSPAARRESAGLPRRLFDGAVSLCNAGGSVWIFVIMTLLSADVISRGLFNAPIGGIPLVGSGPAAVGTGGEGALIMMTGSAGRSLASVC